MVHKTIAVLLTLVALNSNCCHGEGFSWQRLARRANVRAALASKLDPNFWPTRGRRSDMIPHIFLQKSFENRRQTPEEEGPFWANRGRSLSSFLPPFKNNSFNEEHRIPEDISKYMLANGIKFETFNKHNPIEQDSSKNAFSYTPETPNFSLRSDKTDEGPFWANRGRSPSKSEWYDEIQKIINKEKTQARSVDAGEGPFWANRGRAIENPPHVLSKFEIDALLSNLENRDADASKNEIKNDKDAPFWANRGRSLYTFPENLQRDELYAEEPGWILMTQRNGRRSIFPTTASISESIDTFWGARGKKNFGIKEDITCDLNGNQCANKAKLKPIEKLYNYV